MAIARARPFLGICVGMQLMSERGLEKTITRGFGWIAGDVKEIEPGRPVVEDPADRLEHARAEARRIRCSPESAPAPTGCTPISCIPIISSAKRGEDVLAIADYGGPVTAAVARGNVAGTQFHPEKSQALGLALIGNFLSWKP